MPNYTPYNYNSNFYMQDLQNMKDRIDRQMQQLQQQNQQQQMPQQPITQNFQLAPNPTNNDLDAKYADNITEVKNTFVMKTGVFVNKDFSTMWIKDVTGNIRTFDTQEVIEMDEKDKTILNLQKQIDELKGVVEDARQSDNANVIEPATAKKSSRTSSNSKSNK